VHAFDGDGRGYRRVVLDSEELRGSQEEDGTYPFATGLEAVAHRRVQPRGPGFRRWEMQVDTAFDAGDEALVFGRKIHQGA
jgi:hypothetical protein